MRHRLFLQHWEELEGMSLMPLQNLDILYYSFLLSETSKMTIQTIEITTWWQIGSYHPVTTQTILTTWSVYRQVLQTLRLCEETLLLPRQNDTLESKYKGFLSSPLPVMSFFHFTDLQCISYLPFVGHIQDASGVLQVKGVGTSTAVVFLDGRGDFKLMAGDMKAHRYISPDHVSGRMLCMLKTYVCLVHFWYFFCHMRVMEWIHKCVFSFHRSRFKSTPSLSPPPTWLSWTQTSMSRRWRQFVRSADGITFLVCEGML